MLRLTSTSARLIRLLAPVCIWAALNTGCETRAPHVETTHERRPDHAVLLRGPSAEYVKVEPASSAGSTQARALVGQVAFDERKLAALGPPLQGRVSLVNVVVGDRVKEGQVLLTIHTPDIVSARAQVAQARTARDVAERAAARATLLADKGAGTEAERQTAQAALQQAATEEQRALRSLSAIGGALAGSTEYELRAPFGGIVVERNVSVGSEVHTDQEKPLVKVADLSTVWVTADVYEQDLPRIHTGDAATVEIASLPGRKFQGRILSVGNTVDPQTRVAEARIELANPDLTLRPGLFATVRVLGSGDGAVEVPVGAVLARRDQFFVFVRDAAGAYRQREVRPGEQRGQHIAILEGLRPGESVVTEGAILLDAEANEAL